MNTIKCPVCDWDINDGGIKVKADGKEISVCCDDCAKKVEADPAKYAGATEYSQPNTSRLASDGASVAGRERYLSGGDRAHCNQASAEENFPERRYRRCRIADAGREDARAIS